MKITNDGVFIDKDDRHKKLEFSPKSNVKFSMMNILPMLNDYDFENIYLENVIQQLAKDGYILPLNGYVPVRMFWGAVTTYILGRKGIKIKLEKINK